MEASSSASSLALARSCTLVMGSGIGRCGVEDKARQAAGEEAGIATGEVQISAVVVLAVVSKAVTSKEGLTSRDRRCAGLRSSESFKVSGLLRLFFVMAVLFTSELLLLPSFDLQLLLELELPPLPPLAPLPFGPRQLPVLLLWPWSLSTALSLLG